MITYLLPLLIANTGGRLVYGERGGVVATIATMGVIVGTDIPMFLGAMIMGPLAAWITKQMDKLWDGKIKPGFEMLVNNFSAGILGMILAIVGFFAIPVVGLVVGFLGGVYVAEHARLRDWNRAWNSTWVAMKATGFSILIELAALLLAASVWVGALIALD